jgi:hypothetical protein
MWRFACLGLLASVGCAARNHGTPPLDAAVRAAADGAAAPSDGAIGPHDAAANDAGIIPDGGVPGDGGVRICDVKAYGAKGNGTTNDTQAIQSAIDHCAGGIVTLTNGKFLSGTIVLRSHVTLDIAASATLLGSQDIADYPDQNPPLTNTQLANCKKTLVYAESADDIHLQGSGTIDGNAAGVASWNGDQIKEGLRPMAIFTVLSTHVTIQDLTVKNAGVWGVVNMEAQHLTIARLNVDNNLGATHDGIDVVDGNDVTIDSCTIASGDDSICLKSGSATGLQNVTVENCHTTQSGVANGVKFGTASVGVFKNITVTNVVIENAQAAGMAVESVDGSAIANVLFQHITVNNVGTPFFVLLGSRNKDPSQVGSIDGVTFDDVHGSSMRYAWGSLVTGTTIGTQTFTIADITFSNIALTFKGAGATPSPAPFTVDNFPEYQGPVPGQTNTFYNQYPDAKFIAGTGGNENISYYAPGFAFFVRHARNVSFTGCKASVSGADPRAWSGVKDVSGLSGACSP